MRIDTLLLENYILKRTLVCHKCKCQANSKRKKNNKKRNKTKNDSSTQAHTRLSAIFIGSRKEKPAATPSMEIEN